MTVIRVLPPHAALKRWLYGRLQSLSLKPKKTLNICIIEVQFTAVARPRNHKELTSSPKNRHGGEDEKEKWSKKARY